MKQTNKIRCSLKLIILLFISISFMMNSCMLHHGTVPFKYDLGCFHCGETGGGILSIDLAADSVMEGYMEKNYLALVIKNMTTEIILLNPDYFSLTVNNYVIMNPVRFKNENSLYMKKSNNPGNFSDDRIVNIPQGCIIEIPVHNYFDMMF